VARPEPSLTSRGCHQTRSRSYRRPRRQARLYPRIMRVHCCELVPMASAGFIVSVGSNAARATGTPYSGDRTASMEGIEVKMNKVLVRVLGCLGLLTLIGFTPASIQAAVYKGNSAKAVAQSESSLAQGNVILIQNRGEGRRGTARGNRGGGGRGISRRGHSSRGGTVRRGKSVRHRGGTVRRGSGVRHRGGTVRRGRAIKRGAGRRGKVSHRYGNRGRRYRRGNRWYFWAPWAASYIYFGSYDACYRDCRSHGYRRSYCRDLCAW
jgi:hypothetical protein